MIHSFLSSFLFLFFLTISVDSTIKMILTLAGGSESFATDSAQQRCRRDTTFAFQAQVVIITWESKWCFFILDWKFPKVSYCLELWFWFGPTSRAGRGWLAVESVWDLGQRYFYIFVVQMMYAALWKQYFSLINHTSENGN